MKYLLNTLLLKKPFVVLKTAMSLDGKISTTSGESKWITDKEVKSNNVHILRNEVNSNNDWDRYSYY